MTLQVAAKAPKIPPNLTQHGKLIRAIAQGMVLAKNITNVLAINEMPSENTVAGYKVPNSLAKVVLIGV